MAPPLSANKDGTETCQFKFPVPELPSVFILMIAEFLL